MKIFNVKTNKNNIEIEVYYDYIIKEEVLVKKELFLEMCEKGCKNYNLKYSCPPFSPDFRNLLNDCDGIFVIMFLTKLDKIKSTEYNKIRIANSVMKSRLDRIMRELEKKFNKKYFSTGSFRLCRICNKKKNLSCKYPSKMRFSLESTGVDCDYLSKKLFNIPLTWFKDKKSPEYSVVMCALKINENEVIGLTDYITNNYFLE